MKRKNITLAIIIVIVCIMTGCGYESTKEYELLTIRMYTETEQSGIFTTKTEEHTYIEVSYQRPDGIVTRTCYPDDIRVSEDTKVVEEEGYMIPKIFLTPEDYNELYGLN